MNETDEPQHRVLAANFHPTLEVLDGYYAEEEVPLPERPIKALREMLEFGFINVSCLDPEKAAQWTEYMDSPWFRALFLGVEEWYRDQYGAGALAARGNPPLEGVILVRGSPFLVQVPHHRRVIEDPGKLCWMYFEDDLGKDEDPREWIANSPNFVRLSDDHRQDADVQLRKVASSLRKMQHHLLGASSDDPEERGFRASIRGYIEGAANKIVTHKPEEFAFAWMDLQMCAEAALKLVILRGTGTYPHVHPLTDLLKVAQLLGVQFDERRLSTWPSFKSISKRRYGADNMAGLAELNAAYRLILDLAVACVSTVDPPLSSGAGILLHVSPWLIDDPRLPRRARDATTLV